MLMHYSSITYKQNYFNNNSYYSIRQEIINPPNVIMLHAKVYRG